MFVVHERLVVREGLAALARQRGYQVTCIRHDEEDAIAALPQDDTALLILGAGTEAGGLDGPRLAARLIKEHPKLRILAVFNPRNLSRFSHIARAQAMGYVHEDHLDAELPAALDALDSDQFYVSSHFTPLMQGELSLTGTISRRCDEAGLSQRQRQAALGQVMGRSYRQLGDEHNVSASTMETHCQRARDKLGVGTNDKLIHALLLSH